MITTWPRSSSCSRPAPGDIKGRVSDNGQWKYLKHTSPEEASTMMAVPYYSAFAITHAFVPALIGRKSGMIVNITSAAAYMVWPVATSYIAAR